jgi:hypothetical protein
MSLLTICQEASRAIGLSVPSTIIGNTDKQAGQLLYYSNREIRDLADQHDWQVLIKEESIDFVTSQDTYNLPSDLLRIRNDTLWHRDDNRKVYFPLDGPEWQFLKGWDIVTTLNRRSRILDNQLVFYRAPEANLTDAIFFEYISSNKAETSGGTDKTEFTLDTDVPKFDEDLVTMGIIWRYNQARDHSRWQSDYGAYREKLGRLKSYEKGNRLIDMGRPTSRLWGVQVKDHGYGI